MIQIRITQDALDDLQDGFSFYEAQDQGLGDYFLTHLIADVEGLKITAGIHRKPYRDLHRLISRKFPYAIFYQMSGQQALVIAILDCRRNPEWIMAHLGQTS